MVYKDVLRDRKMGKKYPQYEAKFKEDRLEYACSWHLLPNSMKKNPKRNRAILTYVNHHHAVSESKLLIPEDD
jgi:hypothetical protein